MRKTKLSGLTGLGVRPPRRNEEGLGRRQLETAPHACPRCEGRVIQPLCRTCDKPTNGYVICQNCGAGDQLDRRVYCQMCGWDSYLVRG
jgi:hypothetical protein